MVPEGEDYIDYKGSLPIYLLIYLFKKLNSIFYFRIKKNTENFFD